MNASEWIRLKDKLPDHEGRYLVYIPSKQAVYCILYDGDPKTYLSCGVTHWMPLPEPPKDVCGGIKL